MEGGEEGIAGGGEAVEKVEGVGKRQERYGEVDCGRVDWVAVRRFRMLCAHVGRVTVPVTPKHSHTQSLGGVPYGFRHGFGDATTDGCYTNFG